MISDPVIYPKAPQGQFAVLFGGADRGGRRPKVELFVALDHVAGFGRGDSTSRSRYPITA
jgi:hypothetical protein